MKDFSEFFLMNTEDVKRYAVEVLHRFEPDEETECVEIGDGNINYVFKIRSRRDGHSVIVKQADRLLRSSGRPLDIYRNKIEAAILQLEGELAPGYVPEVYYYDETMSATSMEDVSAYGNLRKELAADRVYPHISENISTFMADTLLPTTDLVLDAEEKKKPGPEQKTGRNTFLQVNHTLETGTNQKKKKKSNKKIKKEKEQ